VALAIGVDIGGTKVAAGVVDEQGQVIDRERRETPGRDVAETETTIMPTSSEMRAPKITREKISRPVESVPNQCAAEGAM